MHAKCLRSVDAVRLYFRKYRASKKVEAQAGCTNTQPHLHS